ncbi:hypothetical protein TIFTF001_018740 [Ficus carica]|uniref:Uncharacterized protein n=1 Tax=Ficus carica TaxID=3494 RepID=A0AA88DB08_FICCA|nr:hypothetical protein TIFTF001_018740 [Ficus carica]
MSKSVKRNNEVVPVGRHAPGVRVLDLHLKNATCPTIWVGGDTSTGVSTGAGDKYYFSCQLVQDGVAGAAWADHPEKGSVVIGEVLPEPVPWIPTVVCLRWVNELLVLNHLVPQYEGGFQRRKHYTINNSALNTLSLIGSGVLVVVWSRFSEPTAHLLGLCATCRFLADGRLGRPFEFYASFFPPKLSPINKGLWHSLFHFCREDHHFRAMFRVHEKFREGFSGRIDSFESTDHTVDSAGQAWGTLDTFSGISAIPTPTDPRATKDTYRFPGSGPDWGRERNRDENVRAVEYIWLGGGLRRRIQELGECDHLG